ncbi:MAG TPA: ABC transporter ATP-binding protein, partial [Polyangia bacterium]|nr:ABC transporter ATP-binding protein [Polyangia bacterium]
VAGFDAVREPREVRRRVGYLPDFMGLYHDMRIDEYLGFFADANGLDARRRRSFIERALRMTGLADRAGSFIEELSLGMRGRIAFARALAGDPELLILDEPLFGLDPFARTGFVETLRELRSGGTSALISSHQLADLERLCDDVVFMDRGRVVAPAAEEGGPGAVYEVGLAGCGPEAAAALRLLPGVARAERAAAGGVVIELEQGAWAPDVLRAIVGAGFDVEFFRPRVTSLEERLRRAVDEEERP